MVFYGAFNSILVISQRRLTLLMSFLRLTSSRLELLRVLPKDTPTKSPDVSVGLESRIPDLRVNLSQTSPGFYVSTLQVFQKYCGKRRSCSYRAISPFTQYFSTHFDNFLPFPSTLKLEESKICRLGKG